MANLQTVELYCVANCENGKAYLVNAESDTKAIQLIVEEKGYDESVLCCTYINIEENESIDIVDFLM